VSGKNENNSMKVKESFFFVPLYLEITREYSFANLQRITNLYFFFYLKDFTV